MLDQNSKAARTGKRAVGRPSGYKPEFAVQAAKLCTLGATDAELADFFGVTTMTIWRWQSRHEEFCYALRVAKEEANERVERSLYQRATGYTFNTEKVFQYQGSIVRAKVIEHMAPDPTSMIFWLKNRVKDRWRDKTESEVHHQLSITKVIDDIDGATSDLTRIARPAGQRDGASGDAGGGTSQD